MPMMFQMLMFVAAYYPYENVLTNTCEFDTIRLKRYQVICVDYGLNKKYCGLQALKKEFLITMEQGVNGKNIVIKPSALWMEYHSNIIKLAKFYYSFTCNNEDNEPKLLLNIVPNSYYDKSLNTEFIDFMFVFSMMLTIYIIFKSVCPLMLPNNAFICGLFMGYLFVQYNTYKIYSI
jgi:hypothetical protein